MPKKQWEYESQKKATAKYKKEKTKNLTIRFYPTDMDMLEFIKEQDNISSYVKSLIRADMEKKKGEQQ